MHHKRSVNYGNYVKQAVLKALNSILAALNFYIYLCIIYIESSAIAFGSFTARTQGGSETLQKFDEPGKYVFINTDANTHKTYFITNKVTCKYN